MQDDFTEYAENLDRREMSSLILKKSLISKSLTEISSIANLPELKQSISEILKSLEELPEDSSLDLGQDSSELSINFLKENLRQASNSHTVERAKYYIKRLLKAIKFQSIGKINDIDMNRWKEYGDIKTDSLWYEDKRDRSGAHNAGYWGNFIPQIPRQLMMRFTKKGDWVLDTFSGSGTTLIECMRLGRNGIGIDLSKDAVDLSRHNLSKEENVFGVRTELINGDSTALPFRDVLKTIGVESVQMIIIHPPYWDIIKFSEDKSDLSNSPTEEAFLNGISKIAAEAYEVLDDGRYLAIVIGDKYSKGEWIPLGFRSMDAIMRKGFKLKSTIVKNFDDTKGKRAQKELWRYRALLGGFYVFKHEYIFLFQKES